MSDAFHFPTLAKFLPTRWTVVHVAGAWSMSAALWGTHQGEVSGSRMSCESPPRLAKC